MRTSPAFSRARAAGSSAWTPGVRSRPRAGGARRAAPALASRWRPHRTPALGQSSLDRRSRTLPAQVSSIRGRPDGSGRWRHDALLSVLLLAAVATWAPTAFLPQRLQWVWPAGYVAFLPVAVIQAQVLVYKHP